MVFMDNPSHLAYFQYTVFNNKEYNLFEKGIF